MPSVDWVIVVMFLVVTLVFGLWPGRIRGREAFLISDRKLSGIASGFTIAASKIGGGLLVTFSALVFAYGYEALWLFVGYTLGYLLFYRIAVDLQKEAHENCYYTMADFFQKRFGIVGGVAVGVGCAVSLLGWIFTNLIAGGDVIAQLTTMTPLASTALLAGTIAVYLVAGGFHSVVRTDILQYAAMLVVLAVIVVAMARTSPAVASDVVGKHIPGHQILSFLLLGTLFPMGSAELWQRTYATRDKRGLFQAIGIASVTFIVLGIALAFICLQLRKAEGFAETSAQLSLVTGVSRIVGPILTGLWVIAFMSAILSSADTFVFTTASAIVEDILERVGAIKAVNRVFALRITMLILCLIGVVGSVLFKSVVTVAFFYAGVTMSLGVVALLAFYTSRINGFGIATALAAGLIVSCIDAFCAGVTARTATVNAIATAIVAVVASRFSKIG